MTTQPTYMTVKQAQRHVKAGAWFNHEVWQQFREHLASSVNFRLGFFSSERSWRTILLENKLKRNWNNAIPCLIDSFQKKKKRDFFMFNLNFDISFPDEDEKS